MKQENSEIGKNYLQAYWTTIKTATAVKIPKGLISCAYGIFSAENVHIIKPD